LVQFFDAEAGEGGSGLGGEFGLVFRGKLVVKGDESRAVGFEAVGRVWEEGRVVEFRLGIFRRGSVCV
jgi:hypothetical protein